MGLLVGCRCKLTYESNHSLDRSGIIVGDGSGNLLVLFKDGRVASVFANRVVVDERDVKRLLNNPVALVKEVTRNELLDFED